MKFSIGKSDFKEVLSKVQGLTGRKTNLAITETVLITAKDAGVTVIATDLETGFEGNYPATVEAGGSIAVNSKKLFEIIREFPANEIHIHEVENRWIEIKNDNVEFHIVGMNAEEFQHIPNIENVAFYEADAAAIRRMIEKTGIIVGEPSDKRAHILGSWLEINNGKMRIVTTDGSRLSKGELRIDAPDMDGILVPKKGLSDAAKFIGTSGQVLFGIQDSHLIIRRGGETITIRLLEGDFPRYGDIIEREEGTDVSVDRKDFLSMLRRMSIFVTEQYKGVIFKFSEGKLNITATNPDIGESREEMDISYSGDEIEAAFNPKFFIETLNAIEDNIVILNVLDDKRPCLIYGEADAGNDYVAAIMPMKI